MLWDCCYYRWVTHFVLKTKPEHPVFWQSTWPNYPQRRVKEKLILPFFYNKFANSCQKPYNCETFIAELSDFRISDALCVPLPRAIDTSSNNNNKLVLDSDASGENLKRRKKGREEDVSSSTRQNRSFSNPFLPLEEDAAFLVHAVDTEQVIPSIHPSSSVCFKGPPPSSSEWITREKERGRTPSACLICLFFFLSRGETSQPYFLPQ